MPQYEKFAEWYDIMYDFYDHDADCDYLEQIIERYHLDTKVKSVLDIGCGTGSHAINLARRGYHVTGIDISEGQIQRAIQKRQDRENPTFHVADMRSFNLVEKFDAAVSFFGSMGYVVDEGDIQKALAKIHHHLNPNGLFIFEFWNARAVLHNHFSWHKAEKDDLKIIRLSKSEFDHSTNVVSIHFDGYVLSGDKLVDTFEETHKLRAYSAREMVEILKHSGFEVMGIFENLSFEMPESDPFRFTAIAQAK